MSQFLSKQQYKNHQKGEYIDEERRDLNQTLQMVTGFPWDAQRGVDVKITGPSVTICDDEGNYLKIGIYYNGAFSLYYFTREKVLYEQHVTTIGEVQQMVTDFFNNGIDLQKFAKKGARPRLLKEFQSHPDIIYGLTAVSLAKRLVPIALLLLFMAALTIECFTNGQKRTVGGEIILLSLDVYMVLLLVMHEYITIKYYLSHKNLYLVFLSGSEEFMLGYSHAMMVYKRSDVTEMNVYGVFGKGPSIFNIAEVNFKDGSKILIPGMLLEATKLAVRLNDCKINYFRTANDFVPAISSFGNLSPRFIRLLYRAHK